MLLLIFLDLTFSGFMGFNFLLLLDYLGFFSRFFGIFVTFLDIFLMLLLKINKVTTDHQNLPK